MIRRILISALMLLSSLPILAQTVTITGQVKDSNNSIYANGSGVVTLVPQNQSFFFNGTNPVTSPIPIAGLDSSGRFSVSLINTSLITPASANPQWQFSFCSNPAITKVPYCFTMTPLSLTASGDITSDIQSQAALLPVTSTCSITVNGGSSLPCPVNIQNGTNTTVTNPSGSNIQINASGGGGGGTPGSPVNSVQGNCTGSFCGIQGLNFSSSGNGVPYSLISDYQNGVVYVTSDFNFTACASGCGSVLSGTISAGSNTVTLTPVPAGVNGSDLSHFIQITSSGAPTEYALITGGTASSGASSGTIIFTAAYAHSTSPTISSATTGIQEASNFLPNSGQGNTLKLVPSIAYTCNAPITLHGKDMTFDGQWAVVNHNSFAACFYLGQNQNGTNGGNTCFGCDGGSNSVNFENVTFQSASGTAVWSVIPTSPATIPGGSVTTETLTITSCPINSFPGQLLWLAGTNSGVPTSYFGYGEFVVTTGGTCLTGSSGTIIVTQATPGAASNFLSSHGTGYTLSNAVSAYVEDNLSANGHVHDLRFLSNTGNPINAGSLIQVDNDQSCSIDNINANGGFIARSDADFQSSGVFSPGPFSLNAAVCHLGKGISFSSVSRCVNWFSGNDINWEDGICQNYTSGGFVVGEKRGGFGQFTLGPNVHFEVGSTTPPFGVPLGNPQIMEIGGVNKPVTTIGEPGFTQGSYGTSNGSPWPIFSSLAAQTATQYYYLVAHDNADTGCSSGGDCVTIPVPIGAAVVTDPSANNVTVNWYGWGDNVNQPNSYDLLRVASNSGTILTNMPQAPTGTSTYAVATGLLPSSICTIHNVCSFVDNVAPASLTSYTAAYVFAGNSKRYYPDMFLLPGAVSLAPSGNGSSYVNNPTASAGLYSGVPTCVNGIEFLGSGFIADFTRHSTTGEFDVMRNCPLLVAPVSSRGFIGTCISGGGTCGLNSSGFVIIAASATTVTVSTTAVTNYSQISVFEDTTLGTILGTTCNTTAGRTYAVTARTPGTSFVITTNSAPSVNPACLRFSINNGN